MYIYFYIDNIYNNNTNNNINGYNSNNQICTTQQTFTTQTQTQKASNTSLYRYHMLYYIDRMYTSMYLKKGYIYVY